MDEKIKSVLSLEKDLTYIRLYINYRGEVNATLYRTTSEVYLAKNALNQEKCKIDLISLNATDNSVSSYYVEDLGIGSDDDEDELVCLSVGFYKYTDTLWSYIDGLLNNRIAVYEFLKGKTYTENQKIQLYMKWTIATIDDLYHWSFQDKNKLSKHCRDLATEVKEYL